MTFWCAGFRNVISAYGVNGFSQDHWQALKHHGTQRVVIAFDRDPAGDTAAEKLAEELRSAGIEVFRLLFPQGMDANAFALQVENPAQALGELLQQALWQGKGTPVLVEPELTFSLAAAPQAAAKLPPVPGLSDSETLTVGGPVPESEMQADQFSENARAIFCWPWPTADGWCAAGKRTLARNKCGSMCRCAARSQKTTYRAAKRPITWTASTCTRPRPDTVI